MRASDLCKATLDFLNSELCGAFDVDLFIEADGYITASPEWLAEYLKILFNTVHGSTVVYLKLKIGGGKIIVSSIWQREKELTNAELGEFKRAASSAGFKHSVEYFDGSIRATIKAELDEFKALQIYALSYSEIYEAFKRAFFL